MGVDVDVAQHAGVQVLTGAQPWFGILGPLVVGVGDQQLLGLGGPRQRELLALLLIHGNRFVSAGRLAEALWDGEPPRRADVTLRSHVSHLRRRLGEIGARDALVTRPTGYALRFDPDQLDAHRFERLLGLGQEALGLGEPVRAAELLNQALGQWRGRVLEDLGPPLFGAAESARLEELRLVAMETRIEADLARGRHLDVVAELERLVAAHPFRERLRGQLMLALYRSGRQVDALATYADARRHLADELGLDPGPALSALETAILRHDPALMTSPDARTAVVPPVGRVRPRRQFEPPPDALFAAARRMPMIGRSTELERLEGLWRLVREGDRGVVLVSGEAGVGKTRLVAELVHAAADDEPVLMVGRCDAVAPSPYQPLAGALRSSVEVGDLMVAAPEVVRRRLAPLLDSTIGATRPESPSADEHERLPLFEALEWLLTQASATAPVLLALEDCERLDHASALLLRHLLPRLPGRTLLVICYRDPPGTRHLPLLELSAELASRGVPEHVVLRPLPASQLASLVEAVGLVAPERVVHALWQRTRGNPYYATEMVRHLRAHGGLEDVATWEVPAGVRSVLRQRLRLLSTEAQRVVEGAAVLGREAEFGLLAEVVGLSEDLLIRALEEAVGAGLLIESGRAWKGSYAFSHDLTHEVVYGDLAVPRRQRLHLRVAQALLRRTPSTGRNVTGAAQHMRAAGSAADPVQAAELSLRAAIEARRIYAWEEAVGHAEAAVEILDRAEAQHGLQGEAAVRAATLRLKSSIGYPRAVELLQAALEHYHAAGDDAAAGSVHSRLGSALSTHHSVMDIPRAMEHFSAADRVLGDAPTAFHRHHGLALAAMFGLRTEVLDAASRKAYALAADLDRPDLVALAGWGRAWARFNQGELDEASSVHEAMWATAHQRADAFVGWASVNPAALCATAYLMDPARARMWCRRGLTQPRFDTFRHPHGAVRDQLVLALATMGEIAAARRAADRAPDDAVGRRLLWFLDGDWEGADRSWRDALAADESAGDRHDAALTARWLAGARVLLGDEPEALVLLRRSLALGIEGPQVPTELLARAELARLLGVRGEVAEAADHLARCDEIVSGSQDWRGALGVVEVARGAVAAAKGDRRASDAALARARDVFTAYHLPWRRADALHAWARLLVTAGETDEAASRHRAAWAVYDEIGANQRWRRPLTEP